VMSIEDFARYSNVLYRLTVDFVRAVPEDKWGFAPHSPRQSTRVGRGFAPFSKQLRHVICVRGVYNAAIVTRKVDWTRRHDYYTGPLTREAMLAALEEKQQQLLTILETIDTRSVIDWDGTPFTLEVFTWEFVQHEAIHHGQWSLYAALAGFDTPSSWRSSWGL